MNAVVLPELIEPEASVSARIYGVDGRIASDARSPEEVLDPATLYGDLLSGLAGNLDDQLRELLPKQSLAIRFAKFTDGRAYSLAIRLREVGYRGQLHALGEINQEILHHMLRIGFTHFHLSAPGPAEIDLAVLHPFSAHYQRTAIE